MNEFKLSYETGSTLNGIVLNAAGQVWNVNSGQFQALTLEGWPQFLIRLWPQAIPTLYYGSFPTAIVAQGVYTVQVYNAAEMPPDALPLVTGEIGWNGIEEVSIESIGPAEPSAPARLGARGRRLKSDRRRV